MSIRLEKKCRFVACRLQHTKVRSCKLNRNSYQFSRHQKSNRAKDNNTRASYVQWVEQIGTVRLMHPPVAVLRASAGAQRLSARAHRRRARAWTPLSPPAPCSPPKPPVLQPLWQQQPLLPLQPLLPEIYETINKERSTTAHVRSGKETVVASWQSKQHWVRHSHYP